MSTSTNRMNIGILLGLTVGCGVGAMAPDVPTPSLEIPAPTQHASLPPALASLAYPDADAASRDPFVDLEEERVRSDGHHASAASGSLRTKPHSAPRPIDPCKRPRPLIAQKLGMTLMGTYGRLFVYEDQHYTIGSVFKEFWRVDDIQESRVRLRDRCTDELTVVTFPHDARGPIQQIGGAYP